MREERRGSGGRRGVGGPRGNRKEGRGVRRGVVDNAGVLVLGG